MGEIRDEFITELLDVLEQMNEKATTDGEKELMYRILVSVDENIEFR